MKKAFLILVLAVFAGSMVFAMPGQETSSASANTVRWSFWGGETRIRNYQLTNDIFFTETGIVIAGEPAPGTGDHFNKFFTQFRGGGAADIIQLGGTFSNLNLSDNNRSAPGIENILMPLDQFVRSGILDVSNVDGAALAAGTRDGVLYAISAGGNMPALVYNRSLLERVGAPLPAVDMTWTQFDLWLAAVQARLPSGTYVLTDFGSTATSSMFLGYWAGDNGTPVWDGTRTNLTNTAVIAYLTRWSGYRTAGLIPPAEVAAQYSEDNAANSSLIAGRTAVTLVYSNGLVDYQGMTTDTLDLIMLPNATVSKGLWPQTSQMMGININSKNAQNAAKYINFRLNDPRVWTIMGADPGIPVTPATRAAISASANDVTKKILAYLDIAGRNSSAASPNMPNDTQWNSELHLIYTRVANGQVNIITASQQIMDLITRLTR